MLLQPFLSGVFLPRLMRPMIGIVTRTLMTPSSTTPWTQQLQRSVPSFLAPAVNLCVPNRGMKIKGQLKRRCKDCYFVCRDETMYVMCRTHPRHKQKAMKKKDKMLWMLSHATQSPKRPW